MSLSEGANFSAPKIAHTVDLTELNTLGVKSVAGAFIEIDHPAQLGWLWEEGFFEENHPFILGGGSNVLLKGNPSQPVLKISIEGIEVVKETATEVWITAGSGENWHGLVKWAVAKDFGGIENLALIPGLVGAAPIQNIGAYGVELEQVFEKLQMFDLQNGSFRTLYHKDCRFGYRDSIFKQGLKGRAVVTSVTLRLKKAPHIIREDYDALRSYLQEKKIINPAIEDVFEAVVSIRKSKLPNPLLLGNAGSFFKNPVITQARFNQLKKEHHNIPSFQAPAGMIKVPAGWLIEKAGWKGKRNGNVGTYENQALVIVNYGGATGEEIFAHAMAIQKSVKKKFGIALVPEVNIVE